MSSPQSFHDILTCSDRYEFYSSFAIWPEDVRSDLRAGVKAKQQGNLALSRKLLTQCVLPYLCASAVIETRVKGSPDRFIAPPRPVFAFTLFETVGDGNHSLRGT